MTYNLYKLFKDKFYFDISAEIINDIIDYYSKVDLLELIDTDFYRGLPGTLFLICKMFLDNQQSLGEGECPIVKLDDLVFIGDRFLNFISTNSNDTYGITYGITGLSLTVSILYRITKNINLFFELNEYCVCNGIYGNIDVLISIMNKSDINDYSDFIYKKYFNSLLDIKWFEHSDYPYEAFIQLVII